ncbi:MAG: DNA polymerase III subunit delta [Candidatus Saccharibacteria bacterium]
MLTLLIGENSFEIERQLKAISDSFMGDVEKIDGSQLSLSQLPDLLMGVSLFSEKRLIFIRGLSQNKAIWGDFGNWLTNISDDIHLVLVEPKIDKRLATYKKIKEKAVIKELQPFSEYEAGVVERWLLSEAETMGLSLDKKSIQFLVNRIGFDQWQLFHALEKIALTDDISIDNLSEIIEPSQQENVFNLFETAIKGDTNKLMQMMSSFRKSEDAYRLFGLISSQVFQLVVISSAGREDNISKDFSIHPFVLSKLKPIVSQLGSKGVYRLLDIFTSADDEIKISKADPWLLVEKALLKIAL